MGRNMRALLAAACIAAHGLDVPSVAAHSGGLDANGCHAGSKPYHCHRAPSDMVGNRLRCDLGSRSSECERAPVENTLGGQAQPLDPSRNPSQGSENFSADVDYVFLDCTEGRPIDSMSYGYIRVTPEESVAYLGQKFYEWIELQTDVDLDYYDVQAVFKINRSSLVMEVRDWTFDPNDLSTGLENPKYKYSQCEIVSGSKMEEIRLGLVEQKKSKQRI